MATRAEVIQHIRSYSDVEEIDNGLFRVEFETEEGRSQVVLLNVLDSLLVIVSPFASVDDITPSTAFEMATIFGIAVEGDLYCIRNVSLIADLDESEITDMAGSIPTWFLGDKGIHCQLKERSQNKKSM